MRIGKGKNKNSYSGYKHYHGIKLQIIVNNNSRIVSTLRCPSSAFHDKRIFLKEWKNIKNKINNNIDILGDKAYVGLGRYSLLTPSKRNELSYKNNKTKAKIKNKNIFTKRIKIEHVFAYIKKYKILSSNFYYNIKKIETFFRVIANIYNLDKT